ncbi:MAG: serine/threonine protein kinase [Nannocystis sp.]|uniref:serine/threonine-protein kinase n=1 Tax=Nannocystis sp. TaxID=1962667 RepID=UPI002423E7C1|nr:serine/threonine-protein kinase [Nannocystis sp.]MBK9755266.1 serine/threonine protein kinase [Nannocystis sp.]
MDPQPSEDDASTGRFGGDEETGEYTPPEPEDLSGRVLSGRYRLLRKLGVGGMAVVYLAEQVTIGKQFAIKVMHSAQLQQPDAADRFLREARAVSKIRHEHVIEVVDFGQIAEGPYMVMELLVGEDLCSRLGRERRIAWPRAQRIGLQICGALGVAHAAGVVHRDLKPENCFLIARGGDSDFVKVLDFGIAKVRSKSVGGRALTELGMVFGTPAYMSPEQADGLEVDARSDVYALGVVLFEMLAGRPPFVADSPMGFLKQHMFSAPPSPRSVAPDAGIPSEAEAVVLKALQKDPTLRFQTMDEMAGAIAAVGTGAAAVEVVAEAIEAPNFAGRHMAFADTRAPRIPVWWLAGGGVVLVIVVAVVASMWGGEEVPATTAVVAPVPAPAPAPEPVPTPVLPATVTIRFSVTPEARVIDRRDGQPIGRTGEAAGLSLPRSQQPRELLLVAEGYEEEALVITPNSDQSVERVLRRKKKRTGKPAGKGDGVSLEPVNPFKKGKGKQGA